MDSRKPSADTKLVARHAISTFGGPPNVWRFLCEKEDFSLDVGGCANRPEPGVVSYTTIGLSDRGVATRVDVPANLELAAVCTAAWPLFPNVLAAAAMLLVRQGKEVGPGDAVHGVVAEFYPRATVPHLYLTRPFLWGQRLQLLRGEAKCIAWLLALPINDMELAWLEKQGGGELEGLCRQRRIDMYDLGRGTWIG